MATTAPAPMTNRYAGRCMDCSREVPAGAGTCARGTSGRWEVRHADAEACAGAAAAPAAPRPPRTNRHPITCDTCGTCCDVGEARIARCLGDGGCPTLEHMADDVEGWHGTCVDQGTCASNIAAAQAERIAADERAAVRVAASKALASAATVTSDPVAPAHPASTVIELCPHDFRMRGMVDKIVIEPAEASPRRILATSYRGGDGDGWYDGNYGRNTTAYVAPYNADLAERLVAVGPEPGSDHVALTMPGHLPAASRQTADLAARAARREAARDALAGSDEDLVAFVLGDAEATP